ncbi:sensor domain-containing protein [Mycobacterium sp. B14F4]|uniref:sensor domain-containing protein n=1 Tax=Mycobacterium sp. B14F4 TaxID=3153565 RepID=UPI00325E0BDB
MMRSAAMAMAAVGAAAMLAGCSAPSAPAPAVQVAEAVQPTPDRALTLAMPTADELASMLGASGFMGQLVEGGPDMLLQGVREAEATPVDCVSTRYQLQKVVYEASPVRSVASQSWAGGDADGPSATGFFGVVQFGDPAAAQAFFGASADKWHRCNGQTLVLTQPDRGTQGASRISDVGVEDRIVSAVVMHDAGSTIQRALGIASDCIVDVEISDVAGTSAPGASDAVAVANLMLQKMGVS